MGGHLGHCKLRQTLAVQNRVGRSQSGSVQLAASDRYDQIRVEAGQVCDLASEIEPRGLTLVGEMEDTRRLYLDGVEGRSHQVVDEGGASPLVVHH